MIGSKNENPGSLLCLLNRCTELLPVELFIARQRSGILKLFLFLEQGQTILQYFVYFCMYPFFQSEGEKLEFLAHGCTGSPSHAAGETTTTTLLLGIRAVQDPPVMLQVRPLPLLFYLGSGLYRIPQSCCRLETITLILGMVLVNSYFLQQDPYWFLADPYPAVWFSEDRYPA